MMKPKVKKNLILSGVSFLCFLLFTVLAVSFDVRPIGPKGGEVGFAALNQLVFQRLGVNLFWYEITDWLGAAALLTAAGFGVIGLYQLSREKSIRRVDSRILLLGGFYLLVIFCYLFFEQVVINCRPILLGEGPEASYPSSHTLIVVCIMVSSAIQLHALCPNRKKLCRGIDGAAFVLSAVTVVGRLLSGVHWLSDIVGGLLLSAALLGLYCAGMAFLSPDA